MRRLAKLAVTAEFIVDALKGDTSMLRRFYVRKNPLPNDAKVVMVETGEREGLIYLVLESETFAPVAISNIPELPSVVCETVREASA